MASFTASAISLGFPIDADCLFTASLYAFAFASLSASASDAEGGAEDPPPPPPPPASSSSAFAAARVAFVFLVVHARWRDEREIRRRRAHRGAPARVLERGDDDAAAHAAAKAVAGVDIVVGIARARAPCGAEGTDDAYRDDRDWQKTRLTAGTRAAESHVCVSDVL
jgi:hypothetical protein